MEVWQAIIGIFFGVLLLVISSEKTIDQLIKISSLLGISTFTVGFIIASLGSDMPELVNSLFSSYLGHGDISVGDSFGSVMTQITLVLGLIPFFCTFCRLIPRKFAFVGATEVVVLVLSVIIAMDGKVSRLDGIILVVLWAISMIMLKKFGDGNVSEDPSAALEKTDEPMSKLIGIVMLGFLGIGVGSIVLIESVITISRAFEVSEYIISFFIVALGTSLPELVIEIAAIRRHHFELAVGDIIGSCIVDSTLAIGLGPLFFPIRVSGRQVLFTGVYAILASIIVVALLSYRGINDKKSGGFFLLVYLFSYFILYFL